MENLAVGQLSFQSIVNAEMDGIRVAQQDSGDSSDRRRLLILFWLDIVLIVFEIIGAFITLSHRGLGAFSYFTEDSNYFTLIACLCEAICLARFLRGGVAVPHWTRVLKYVATCGLMMTFLVVFLILMPWIYSAGYDGFQVLLCSGAQPFMHLLCPLIAFVSFAFMQTDMPLKRNCIWLGATPVYIYGFVATILNAMQLMVGPYPFLYFYKQPLWASVFWVAGMVVFGTAVATAIWAINKHVGKKNSQRISE